MWQIQICISVRLFSPILVTRAAKKEKYINNICKPSKDTAEKKKSRKKEVQLQNIMR